MVFAGILILQIVQRESVHSWARWVMYHSPSTRWFVSLTPWFIKLWTMFYFYEDLLELLVVMKSFLRLHRYPKQILPWSSLLASKPYLHYSTLSPSLVKFSVIELQIAHPIHYLPSSYQLYLRTSPKTKQRCWSWRTSFTTRRARYLPDLQCLEKDHTFLMARILQPIVTIV